MNINDLTYGVELEFNSPFSKEKTASCLKKEGIDVRFERYNHVTKNHWKLTTDGSLTSSGCELVSPILKGEEGLEHIKKITSILQKIGCKIDDRCGFHVHIGVKQIPNQLDFFKKLVMVYNNHIEIFDSLMPAARRKNSNSYCCDFITNDYKKIKSSVNLQKLILLLQNNRYTKLNLHSYWLHGTVEFRHHSGTLSFYKIKNWIDICRHLVVAATNNDDVDVSGLLRSVPVGRRSTANYQKLAREFIAERFDKDEPFTQVDVNAYVGSSTWGTVLGLLGELESHFDKKRVGRPISYKKKNKDFFEELNLPENLKEYIYERRETLN
jgi:hypothetical protein